MTQAYGGNLPGGALGPSNRGPYRYIRHALKGILRGRMKHAILGACPLLSRFTHSWKRHLPYDVPLWDRFYGAAENPYAFGRSWEDRKYAFTLLLCGDGPFRRALEIACSIGLFTVMLAPRCAQLLAVDISQVAVDRARILAADFPQATFQRLSMPLEWPCGPFDLIVCSDVLYYWPEQDLRRALPTIANLLEPAGRFVVLHWLGKVVSVSSGTAVHDILRASMPLLHVEGGEADFRQDGSSPWRYDVFEKRNGHIATAYAQETTVAHVRTTGPRITHAARVTHIGKTAISQRPHGA